MALRSFGAASLFGVVAACGAPSPAPQSVVAARPSTVPSRVGSDAGVEAAGAADPALHTARIERIEHGLLPRIRVKGDEVTWTLDARMREHKVPGLSVAVFIGYRLAWARAYGVADADTAERVTETTLFQAGSISKTVTAVAALGAVEAGELALDAPVNDALKSWKLPENELTRATPVTLRHLMSHTAGTTVHGFPGYAAGAPLPTLVQVLDGLPPANTGPVRVDLAPGTKFRYSGGGTTITQLALVDRLARPFPAILEGRVLGPCGMEHSTYEQPLPPERVKLAAAGHDVDGKVIEGKRHVYPEMAAAGLWTVPSDLAKVMIEIQLARAGRPMHVSPRVATWMTTAVMRDGPASVGLGVFLDPLDGSEPVYFGHNGADEGFQAMATAHMNDGYGVVMMGNSDNSFELFKEMERAIAAEYGWAGQAPVLEPVAVDAARLRALEGRYASGILHPFTLVAKGARLEMRRPFREPVELVPVVGDAFVSRGDGTRFEVNAGGTITRKPTEGGDAEKATRLAEGAKVPILELEAGRYDSALAGYKELAKKDPKSPAIEEDGLNELGVHLLMQKKDAARAVLVFRINAALHPLSMNVWDSLGEGFMKAGERAKAVQAYKSGLAVMARDTTTPARFKEQLKKNAETKLRELETK